MISASNNRFQKYINQNNNQYNNIIISNNP